MEIIKGNLELKEDTIFNGSIEVEGDVKGNYNLKINGNFYGMDFKGRDFNGMDFNGMNFNGKNIKFYGLFSCYNSIKCKSIKARRKNARCFVLDGNIEVDGVDYGKEVFFDKDGNMIKKVCSKCGK